MTKLVFKDLRKCKTLDKKALYNVRGGHSYGGSYPVNIEEILGKYMESLPGYPMPQPTYEPAGPTPSEEPIPFGGGGPADGPL